MNSIDIDEYTLVSDIKTKNTKFDGANAKYCRIKVTNKPLGAERVAAMPIRRITMRCVKVRAPGA